MLTDREIKEKKSKATKVDINSYGYKNGSDIENWIASGISKVYMRNFGIRLLVRRFVNVIICTVIFINFITLCFSNDLQILGLILSIPIMITVVKLIFTCIRFNAIRNREYKLIDLSIKGASIDFTASDCKTAYFFDTEIGRIRALDSEELFKILNDKDKARKYRNCTAICIGKKPYLAYLSSNELFGEAPDKYGNTREELERDYGKRDTLLDTKSGTLQIPEKQVIEIVLDEDEKENIGEEK